MTKDIEQFNKACSKEHQGFLPYAEVANLTKDIELVNKACSNEHQGFLLDAEVASNDI